VTCFAISSLSFGGVRLREMQPDPARDGQSEVNPLKKIVILNESRARGNHIVLYPTPTAERG
jgi:hypothetical protein